jgi:hypothetical protein
MPSLLNETVAANYNQPKTTNGLGPKTTIVKLALTNMTTANLHAIITYITAGKRTSGADTTSDAFSVAGVATADGTAFESGVTDVVFLALQGTGTFTTDASDAYGVTGAVTTIESVFVNPF